MKVRILRYDPAVNAESSFVSYEVPWGGNMSAIDVLSYVEQNIDPSLGFRYECQTWKCGTCAMEINGRPGLACKYRPSKDEELSLEPLSGYPVMKDLAVNFERSVASRVNRNGVLLKAESLAGKPLEIDQGKLAGSLKLFTEPSRCIECWSCMASCPVLGQGSRIFGGPAFFVGLAEGVFHPFGSSEETTDLLKKARGKGLSRCVGCYECEDVCPVEINPANIIKDVRWQYLKESCRKWIPFMARR